MKRLLALALSTLLLALTAIPAEAHSRKQLKKWGEECLGRKNYECAEKAYRQLLEKETDGKELAECYTNLAFVCMKTDRQAEAAEYLDIAVTKDPSCWKAWSALGLMAYDDGQLTQAVAHYTTAIDAGADHKAQRQRAMAYFGLKMWDEAAADYLHVINYEPSDYWTFCNLANAMYNNGDYENALKYSERAIWIIDTFPGAYLTKGMALLNLNEKPAAKIAFEKALQLDPDNTRITELLGKCE